MRVTGFCLSAVLIGTALLGAPPPAAEEIPVVRPEMIREITDISGDFFFQRPRQIKIAPDRGVLVRDRDKLLHFGPNGAFIRDYFEKGEGPGQLRGIADFFFTGEDRVVLGGFMPFTLLVKSLADGRVIREHRDPESDGFATLMYTDGDGYWLRTTDLAFANLKTGINETVHKLFYCSPDHQKTDTGLTFSTLDVMIKKTDKEGRTMVAVNEYTRFHRAFDHRGYGYFSHTERYRVQQLDLEKKKIIRKFSRPYEPVPFVEKEYERDIDRELAEQANRKCFCDIQKLAMHGDDLLVFTSTLDPEKGVLVDVFGSDRTFRESFYLDLPGLERPDDIADQPLCFGRDCLWTAYPDEEENPMLVKMKFERL